MRIAKGDSFSCSILSETKDCYPNEGIDTKKLDLLALKQVEKDHEQKAEHFEKAKDWQSAIQEYDLLYKERGWLKAIHKLFEIHTKIEDYESAYKWLSLLIEKTILAEEDFEDNLETSRTVSEDTEI